jgi:hypothetical protein
MMQTIQTTPSEDLEPLKIYVIPSTSEEKKKAPTVISNLPRENFMIRTITNHTSEVKNAAHHHHHHLECPIPMQATSAAKKTFGHNKNNASFGESRNIPAKKSRLVTSLATVMRPVKKLVISIDAADTDTDDEKLRKSPLKKTRRTVKVTDKKTTTPKLSVPPPEFEKNLESYLKKIRMQQENAIVDSQPQPKSVASAPKPTALPVKSTSATITTKLAAAKTGPVASSVS